MSDEKSSRDGLSAITGTGALVSGPAIAHGVGIVDWRTVRNDADWPYMRELDTQKSDRALAIIGAAFTQDVLKDCIRDILVRDKTTFDRLFKPGRPIGDLVPQILLGFMLSLYDKQFRDDLLAMAEIRNLFAHRLKLIQFNSEDVASKCYAIKNKLPAHVVADLPTDPRDIYVSFVKTAIDFLLRNRPAT